MYHIYTDGASRGNPGKASYAFVVYAGTKRLGGKAAAFPYDTTNNEAELTAILAAFQHVRRNLETYQKAGGFNLYSDSAYALNVVFTWSDGWQKNGWRKKTAGEIQNLALIKDIWALKHELLGVMNIQQHKVKGHSDNYGNNEADRMCNEVLDK